MVNVIVSPQQKWGWGYSPSIHGLFIYGLYIGVTPSPLTCYVLGAHPPSTAHHAPPRRCRDRPSCGLPAAAFNSSPVIERPGNDSAVRENIPGTGRIQGYGILS